MTKEENRYDNPGYYEGTTSTVPTFVGGINKDAGIHQIPDVNTNNSGWHIQLKTGNSELTWCIDTGAQVSVMPQSLYDKSFGQLSEPDRHVMEHGTYSVKAICIAL